MLAGLVQSPTNDDPINQPGGRAWSGGTRSSAGCSTRSTSRRPTTTRSSAPRSRWCEGQSPPNNCVDAAIGGFFCAYLEQYLTDTLGLTDQQIRSGGLTIQTTLRPDMQAAGDQAVLNTLPMGDPLAGMYTAVEPGTGHVLAMSVNRRVRLRRARECESVVLNAVASQGAGSTYKVFTAAAALERGFSQYYTLTTGDPYVSRVYRGTAGAAALRRAQRRQLPGDAGHGAGALHVLQHLLPRARGRAGQRRGAGPDGRADGHALRPTTRPADDIIAENRGSFTFGADATSPLDLASAYSTLAANGTRCDPTPVVAILDRDGEPLLDDDGQPVVQGRQLHRRRPSRRASPPR